MFEDFARSTEIHTAQLLQILTDQEEKYGKSTYPHILVDLKNGTLRKYGHRWGTQKGPTEMIQAALTATDGVQLQNFPFPQLQRQALRAIAHTYPGLLFPAPKRFICASQTARLGDSDYPQAQPSFTVVPQFNPKKPESLGALLHELSEHFNPGLFSLAQYNSQEMATTPINDLLNFVAQAALAIEKNILNTSQTHDQLRAILTITLKQGQSILSNEQRSILHSYLLSGDTITVGDTIGLNPQRQALFTLVSPQHYYTSMDANPTKRVMQYLLTS